MNRRGFFGLIAAALGIQRALPKLADGGIIPKGTPIIVHTDNCLPGGMYDKMIAGLDFGSGDVSVTYWVNYNEARELHVQEIARVFRVHPHMIRPSFPPRPIFPQQAAEFD